MLIARAFSRTFHFAFEARTSRGLMAEKKSWFIDVRDHAEPELIGVGEAGPLPGLSVEDLAGFDAFIQDAVTLFNAGAWSSGTFDGNPAAVREALCRCLGTRLVGQHPAFIFAIETALRDLRHRGRRMIFDNSFYGGTPLPINGLVWMGTRDFMREQIALKMQQGFSCIKLKIGGLDFGQECEILEQIRTENPEVVIRLDANGAFTAAAAPEKLNALAKFKIHSLEQPVPAGDPGLRELCRTSPIPIALDEELIGITSREEKASMLDHVRPAFIVIKPTLHGGLGGSDEWIALARERGIGWWITSALESSIGLNAVSQFAAEYPLTIPQGLGTGMIYTDNIASPLEVENGFLRYNSAISWGQVENN